MTTMRERGFSLVEVMVAMLIGLIGTIIIFQVFAISEAQKRTTTGVSDAQQNGLLALFSLEREARMSGYGVNYAPLLGCNVLARDNGQAASATQAAVPARDFTFTLAAVQIANGAAGAPDALTFVYGNSNLSFVPSKLTAATVAGQASNKVDVRFGWQVNDLMLLGEVGKDCTMRQVSALSNALGSLDLVDHTGLRYNKGGGMTVAYSAWDNTTLSGARAYTLGSSPAVVTYNIVNSQLQVQNVIATNVASAIVDGIVQLQAEYGKDADNDGAVETWDNVAPTNANEWASVIAVRMAVVARSQTPEKPNPTTGVCDTTAVAPTWKGGTAISLTADPDWQCYRYRTFETVVPLRNLIWTPE